jgi:hypothetical protein
VTAFLPAWCSKSWDDILIQGFERSDRQLLDAAVLAGHLVPAGGMFAFLAAHRAEVFPDVDYGVRSVVAGALAAAGEVAAARTGSTTLSAR